MGENHVRSIEVIRIKGGWPSPQTVSERRRRVAGGVAGRDKRCPVTMVRSRRVSENEYDDNG
jgi:hypothetical protein